MVQVQLDQSKPSFFKQCLESDNGIRRAGSLNETRPNQITLYQCIVRNVDLVDLARYLDLLLTITDQLSRLK